LPPLTFGVKTISPPHLLKTAGSVVLAKLENVAPTMFPQVEKIFWKILSHIIQSAEMQQRAV